MASYTVILLDTEGTELSRQEDFRSLVAAKAEAKAVAKDMEYKNSSPGAVQVINEKGELWYGINHVIRERQIKESLGVRPFAKS